MSKCGGEILSLQIRGLGPCFVYVLPLVVRVAAILLSVFVGQMRASFVLKLALNGPYIRIFNRTTRVKSSYLPYFTIVYHILGLIAASKGITVVQLCPHQGHY